MRALQTMLVPAPSCQQDCRCVACPCCHSCTTCHVPSQHMSLENLHATRPASALFELAVALQRLLSSGSISATHIQQEASHSCACASSHPDATSEWGLTQSAASTLSHVPSLTPLTIWPCCYLASASHLFTRRSNLALCVRAGRTPGAASATTRRSVWIQPRRASRIQDPRRAWAGRAASA